MKAAGRQAELVDHTKGWNWTMCHHLLKLGALFEKGVQLEEFTLACQGPGLYVRNFQPNASTEASVLEVDDLVRRPGHTMPASYLRTESLVGAAREGEA